MRVQTRVTGYSGIGSSLEEIQRKLARGAMRDSMTKAGRIIAAEVKAQVPVRFGTLKKAIKSKVKTVTKNDSVYALVGPSRKISRIWTDENGKSHVDRPANYAHLVERGTKSRGVWGIKGRTTGPGNAPNPFMRRAWASKEGLAKQTYRDGLADGIKKTAARMRKRKGGR